MTEQLPLMKPSPWPHRLAVVLALVTFPLIWVGGLVTTYDAGMAVPDWPGTFGYNLFLYPLSTWWSGPWDLFVEHGHRLLGSLAGLVTIALVAVVWLTDSRRWLRDLSLAALALVIFQGVLGGARVLLDERMVALIHGCTGPLFFALSMCLVEVTSAHWRNAARAPGNPPGARFARSAWIVSALVYLQLTAGAVLRHIPAEAPPHVFRAALLFHLVFAGVLTLLMLVLAISAFVQSRQFASLRVPSCCLSLLVLLQALLGLGSYVLKYSWPAWMDGYRFAASYVVEEKGLAQALIVTEHVAAGSLILACTTALALRASRLFARQTIAQVAPPKFVLRAAS